MSSLRRFRFGVNMWSGGSRAEWTDTARKVEGLGYSVLTVPDHLTEFLAPIPALAVAAEATQDLRVGTMVLNNDLRHPVVVAREAATLDLLSGGRLELGLGAGHMKSEYDQAGLSFDRGATRVERLTEAVAIVKGLLAGEPFTFPGRHYRVTRHKIHPLPAQRPHPPILMVAMPRGYSSSPGEKPTSSDCRASRSAKAERSRTSPRGERPPSASASRSCASRPASDMRIWS